MTGRSVGARPLVAPSSLRPAVLSVLRQIPMDAAATELDIHLDELAVEPDGGPAPVRRPIGARGGGRSPFG